jgi:N4-gp56 family major capsid protein
MALGTNNTTPTTADAYIPLLWSDEVIADFKKNIVMANLVTRFDHNGKRGDSLQIPKFTRSSASAKSAGSEVTLVAPTHGSVTLTINKHFEHSVLLEDIVAVQALDTLRQHYTEDAGYSLAKQIDTDVIQLGRSSQGGNGTAAYNKAKIGGDGSTDYVAGSNNETAVTDAGIRKVIQTLDDADVPTDQRFLMVPAAMRNTLMGLSRFTEQAFTGEGGAANTIRNGVIGNLYGVTVYVSSNADTTSGSGNARVALLGHPSAFGLAMQQNVRTQTQYKQEYLADLFTADVLYGVAELRDDAAVAIAVPA